MPVTCSLCGIVGYVGDRNVFPILVNGLKRLEYRGYDSSGVALAQNGEITLYKKQGIVKAMEKLALVGDTSGSTGIAHTHVGRRTVNLRMKMLTRTSATRAILFWYTTVSSRTTMR